jgi:outer membrane protein assembly factor BamB
MFKPILNNSVVFVRTGHVRGTVYALDGETGRIIWEKEDAVSNVAVSNSIAFYVTIDGEVMAIDAQTGETMGRLKFNTEELVDINTSDNPPYYVEAVDDMVFVYFGDTWQLFAFRFSQE